MPINDLRVGLNVITKQYKKGNDVFWYEGMIMGFKMMDVKVGEQDIGTEEEPEIVPVFESVRHAEIRPYAVNAQYVTVPVEDIVGVSPKMQRDRQGNIVDYIRVDEFTETKTGRKLKPSGERLPDDYTGRIKEE